MKTLYISDLDGTLLNSQGKISNYSIETINHLVEQGMIFTYATARSLVSAAPVTEGLTKNLPLIIYNGTFIVNGQSGKIMHKSVFNHLQVEVVKQIMESKGLKPMVYALVNDKERVTIINKDLHVGVKHYLSNRQDDYRINLTLDENSLYQGEVFYFTVIGDYEDLYLAYEALKYYPEYNITFQQEIYREEYWLEIMPKTASKASAILKLKELLECDEVVSFGDAVNDLPMFKISDQCYAMANAVEQLKQQATAVIQSNDEDGVACWLNKHFIK
ncbi:MAG: HAD family hydrolase [Thomasclavelia sp.]|uniref:HAD family hydrolase n=1 Tax=Thomasclavelia sp. TaxID=3025757 RepID=UPI0039A089DC